MFHVLLQHKFEDMQLRIALWNTAQLQTSQLYCNWIRNRFQDCKKQTISNTHLQQTQQIHSPSEVAF